MNKYRKVLPPLSSLLPFEATVRLGSITQAAAELGLTQAAVSRQIKGLEENLGIRLFERRNRAVYVTDAGQEFCQVVVSSLKGLCHSATRMRDAANSSEVVLFAQLCEGLYWVMPKLSGFYQQHPNIEVKVSVSTLPLTETAEYFDVAFQTSCRRSGDCDLVFTAPDEIFAVCSPGYLAQHPEPHSLDQIADYHLLHHRVYPQDWINWDDWLAQIGKPVKVGFAGSTYDSYPMMIQAAIEGHGISLGWQQTTGQLLASGALTRPFSESLYLPDGLSVYQHPQCEPRPEVQALLDWLKQELTLPNQSSINSN